MALTNHIVSDSPSNNFATLNRLHANLSNTSLQEGNLKWVKSSSSTFAIAYGSIGVSSGKYYYELDVSAYTLYFSVGFFNGSAGPFTDADTDRVSYQLYSGVISKIVDGTFSSVATGKETSTGIIGVAIDCDNGEVSMYHNNTLQATATGLRTNQTYFPRIYVDGANNSSTAYFNFGQDPTFGGAKSPSTTYTDANGIGAFYYQPPTGALALCTANLPDFTPDVTGDTPQDYFKAVIWTGQTNAGVYNNGNVTVGFQPDLVWIKDRTSTTPNYNHQLYDSLRGSNSGLIVNENYAATNYSAFSSFDSNGFTVPNALGTNTSSANMVAWCWKAGDAPTASDDGTGVSGSAKLVDTSGAASSTTCKSFKDAAVTAGASNVICPSKMSINQAAGFSIIKYNTGQTGHLTGGPYSIPHGLGAEPKFIIIKSIDNAFDWLVYHRSVANVNYTQLNASNAFGLSDSNTYSGSNTEYVVNIGGTQVIAADGDYIMYSWSPVEGYSKFGSYTGNGSADGPFVYCGFRPAFVMVKNTDETANWVMYDNKRNTSNLTNKKLAANLSNQENEVANLGDDSIGIDLLSNGFKIRTTGTNHNNSNINYIFMAFAEQPFKFSNAR